MIKQGNYACIEAIIRFTNTKGSLHEFNSDRSVCKAAIWFQPNNFFGDCIVNLDNNLLVWQISWWYLVEYKKYNSFPQSLDFDRSVCVATICYSSAISAVPTNEQFLEKDVCKISDQYLEANILFYIHFIGSPTFPSGCYKLCRKLKIPSSRYK